MTEAKKVDRRTMVLERARANGDLILQDGESLASYRRGEPAISGPQVRAEAQARRQQQIDEKEQRERV